MAYEIVKDSLSKINNEKKKAKKELDKLTKQLVDHLRMYQHRVDKAQDDFMSDPEAMRGVVLAGTGSGKTELFIVLIKKMILLAQKAKLKKILIAHPRLALSFDQQKRLKKAFANYFSVEFTSFSSGKVIDTWKGRKNQSTTNLKELQELQDSCSADLHITFSSYDSLHKIADMHYDLIVCDEAHYLCNNKLRKNLYLFRDDVKVLFYTATPIKVAAQEESMDNIELFGEVIANVPPSELIPYGYVVAPRVRFMNVRTKNNGNTVDYATTIGEAYKDQLAQVDKRYNHKMLVAMPNTQFFDEIMAGLGTIRKIVGNWDVDLYYVSADGCSINGKAETDREKVLEHFAKNENKCIIIHCDTLAEGIDIDGIGGVFLLRNLGLAKTIQTIGRACRPAKQDINEDGTIKEDRIKTNAIVTLAMVDGEWFSNAKTSDYAEAFKQGGYEDLWDYVDPEFKEEGKKREGNPDTEDSKIKEIEDAWFVDRVDELYEQMKKDLEEK
jgi:superfamily II DNA or RNA helicase